MDVGSGSRRHLPSDRYAYLLREADGSVRAVHDRHVEGFFPRALWLRLLDDAGFLSTAVPFDHSELEPGTYEVFVGRRRSGPV